MNPTSIRRSSSFDNILSKSPTEGLKRYYYILIFMIALLALSFFLLKYRDSISCDVKISTHAGRIESYAIIKEDDFSKIKQNQLIIFSLNAYPTSKYGNIQGILQIDSVTTISNGVRTYIIPIKVQLNEEFYQFIPNTSYYGRGDITVSENRLINYIICE